MIGYYSTRDPQKNKVSFADALLKGLAPDGGLYVPDAIPQVNPAVWLEAPSVADLGVEVLGAWLGDEIPAGQLEAVVRDALNFPTPVVRLSDDLFVLELIHGPTLSFKDYGARTMARLMQYFLSSRGERRVILVATSGDTGSAVADGFAGQDNIEVVLLYPKGKVSTVQERQLIVERPGVRSFAVEGDFDDCQRMVKEAFVDPGLADLPLSSANSINIGRLLPQSLYYLWAANRLHSLTGGSEINFCVPSGNLGNLTGGIFAALVGQPVHRFVAAHNANDFFPNYLAHSAEAFEFRPTVATVSNAMDVGAPSNFERLHHLLSEERARGWIWGTSVHNADTLGRMKAVYDQFGYVACPHTSVGLEAVHRYRQATGDPTPFVTLACAHPAKFPEAVSQTLGIPAPTERALEALFSRPVRVETIAPTLAALRERLT
ncbi:MAG: threonine synthase [Meiothermus sp.]|nr:threonine synthase [Meiothermus sp.]